MSDITLEELKTIVSSYDKLKSDHDAFINKGGLFLFELELKDNEYLSVELTLTTKGIEFSGDFNSLPTAFDGEIIEYNENSFMLPFNFEYELESLDRYLELIMGNLMEGYILPNNLDNFNE
jgi:hypothetical protein